MSKQATGFNQPEIDIDVLMGRKPIPTSGTQPQAPVAQNDSGSAIDMDVLMGRKPIPTAGGQPEPSESSEVGEIPNNPDAAFDAFLGPKIDLSPEAIRERTESSASPFAKGIRDAVGSVQAQGGYNPVLGKDAVAQAAQKKVYQPLNKNLADAVQGIIDHPDLRGYELNADNLDTYLKTEEERASFEEVLRDRYGDTEVLVSDLSTISRPMESGEEILRSVVFTHNGENIEIPIGLAEDWVAQHNAEVLHNENFREDPEYRNKWFLSNLGISEQTYRNEVAADLENRLQELRKKIVATLPAQHTRGGYAAIGAAANKPSSGAPVSLEKIDKALKVVNTLRKNNFGAGLKEGFDPADILTLGVSGIGENVALLNALNKSASGKTLTTSEQALVEAWDIQNEAEEVIDTLGGRKRGAKVGYGVSQALGFMTQTAGTGGIASLATKGIGRAAARTALLRATNMGVNKSIKEGLRYGGLKVAESAVGAAARTPFMGFTYQNYTDKRLNQFQVKERVDEATGEISKYIDKQEASALRDAAHAVLESYFESQSEDVGGLIDFGITSFARALPLKGLLRNRAAEALRGPVKNGAMKLIKEGVKLHSIIGETLSEAYGDAMVNLLTANNEGWKQMATSEYWWELGQVSSILSGGFWVANQGVNFYVYKDERKAINKNLEQRKKALSRIEDDNLKKELTEATLTDDLIDRSKRLSGLDWSNFSREDMANAVDFIDAQTRLDVMREGATESRRLARIMPAIDEVKKLADGGALDDEQAAASLATIYSDLFRTQENQRTLNILTDRIKVAADAGISADKINDILRGAGLTVFNPGDEIETLTGDRAIVDKVLPGAYEIVNDEGVRAVVSFEEVLQNAPEIRQIQQESQQPVTQSESAPEINPQVEQAVEVARQEAADIINKDDSTVYEVETDDGITGYIIGGKGIVVDNDGGINQSAEDTVVVKTDEGNKVVHKERVKVKSRQTLQEIEDLARGAAEGALAAVQPQQPVGGKIYQGIYDNEQVTINLPREIKFNEDGSVDYDSLLNPETVSVIRPGGIVVDEVNLSEIDELTEVKPEAEQVPADTPVVEQQEEVQHVSETKMPYELSDEVDENGRQFVKSSTGAIEFGQVDAESGLAYAPILLSEGMITNKATNDGYGLVHIEARHGDQIRKAGYNTVVEFVEDVAKNYEVIKEGNVRDGHNTYLLQLKDKHNNTLMVELSGDGTYWNINTAGVFKTSYGKNRKEVYNRHTTAKQPAETIEASRNPEPSGTQGSPSMVTASTLVSSDNKDTTSEPKNQEVAQKNVAETTSVVQQPQIPTLKNGEPDYNAMDAQMFVEQYVSRFGEERTEKLARNNIKVADKAIDTLEKQIDGATDPNKIPALYEKQQTAKVTRDKYATVLDILGLSVDENEDNAARVQRKKQENTSWFNKLFPDGFPNVESVILWDIANGNRIRWANKEVNGAVVSKGLGSHLGLADSNAERTRRVALIGKDAPTPEEYAEQLPERLKAMGVRFEEGELRDKVLDVYASVDTIRKAKEELETMSANMNAEQEGLDYEEEQMRRNYEREQEALRQEAQADVVYEQTEQGQPTNEETQEEELSIEDEVPFMVSSDSVQATTEAQKLATEAAITALEDAGVEVVNATPEMVEEALQQRDVVLQAVRDSLTALRKAESFIRDGLRRNVRGKSFRLALPESVASRVRKAMGRDFDSHNITINGVVHALRNHGVGGIKLSEDSLPITEEDVALIPYIMVAPDLVEKASTDLSGRDSVRFYKNLSNGYVVVVEKEYKNSPDDMETITMWAELSPKATNARRTVAPDTHVQNAILSTDVAKIRKDAENAIRQDVQMHIEQQNSIDAAYMEAVKAGDMERAKELVREYAESRGYYLFGEFRDAHAAPSSTVDKPDFTNANLINEKSLDEGWDVNLYSMPQGENLAPNDFWSPMGPRWYMYNNKAGMEAYSAIAPAIRSIQYQIKAYGEVRDIPSVKVYRDVPNSVVVDSLENGDWVTPSLIYANTHGLARFGEGEYRIIEQEVPATDLWWDGNDAREWGYDNGNVEAYANTPNHIKSLAPITYDDAGNIIPLSARFDPAIADSRFSIGPAPVFVSNAKIAVLGIKQEKATPEQWLKMIEKAGGLKAGEDKWIGLSDWLKASDKKTLTKQEVLDYINENQIQIEEVKYSEFGAGLIDQATKKLDAEMREIGIDAMREKYPDFDNYFELFDGELVWSENNASEGEYEDYIIENQILDVDPTQNGIHETRIGYTTDGLENKHEIALTVPTIESWSEGDQIHFGDAGDGRAIAWIRFGETTDSDGKRVLVIDEIQSKRHQEGREKGYRPSDVDKYLKNNNVEVVETGEFYEFYRDGELDRRFSKGLLHNNIKEAKNLYVAGYNKSNIPEAPFEKNWAELAMKRMLRYAAENDFDKVAWTKGDQQGERYDMTKTISKIGKESKNRTECYVDLFESETGGVISLTVDKSSGEIIEQHRGRGFEGKNLSDVLGKSLAHEILSSRKRVFAQDNLRIGGEGMRAFYDQMLPSFMNKYGKKWGVKVQDVTLSYVEEVGRTMHSVDVTESMRESVMQGQPMFYRRPNGTVYGWTNGTTVYLTESGMNPNTPIHEYTHIWADAMRKHNPEGWASIVKLLKGTPVWNEVMADTNYANIHGDENKVASEALSRISGRENSAKMEAMAQLMIDENANDTVRKNRARKLLDRMRKALQEFWSWVGKELFGIKNFERIEQVTDRILYDLVSGTDLVATPSLAGQVKAVIDEYDNADEVFTINDVAERISEVVNNYTGTESTTELENILEDFEEAQNSAGRYGYRMDSGGEDAFEEALRAYAAKAPIEGFSIQPQERAEIIRASKASETYLKAPNGKDTNLTPEQWVTVRTKAFKRWFGDWENGGESSQVLDANGEPLVVWHGGEFATDEFVANGSMHFGTKVAALQRILDNAWGYGNWSVARNDDGRWSWKYTDPDDSGYDKQSETAFALPIDALVDAARIAAPKAVVRPYFLNIRNLERTEDQNSDWVDAVSFSMDAGYDGIIYRNDFEDEGEDSYVAFYPNQIKLAEGNTTFDSDNDDVRFSIDVERRERTEKIVAEVQRVADAFGLSNEIVVAETQEVFVNELQSENVADEFINSDAIAVFTPSGRIMVNAQMIPDIAELPDSIMHEFAHNVTHNGDMPYRIQDTVLEVGEERFEAFGRELFETNQDPWVVADEIIATFVGNAANPTLYEGVDLISGVVSGQYTTDEAVAVLMESLTSDIRDGYVDVIEGMMPYVKEVLDAIKTNHDEQGTRAGAPKEKRRVRISVQGYAGEQKKGDNRSNDESYIRHEGYRVNQATSATQAAEEGRLERVNEFSIGPAPVASESQGQTASDQENKLTPQEDKAKDKTLKQLDRLNKVINSLRQTVKQAERDNVDLANIVQAALEEEVKDGGINRFLDVPELISLIRSGMDKKSIESTMDRLSERLTDAIIKNREEQLAKLLQVQVQGTNAFGIPIGYAVDDETRAMVEFFRENLSRDMKKIVETMENADEKFLQPYNKSELNVWFTAYKEIEESRYNIKATQKDIDHETERSQSFYRLAKELKAKNASESQIKTAQEHRRQALRNKKAQKKAILVAKQTLAQELEGMIFLLGGRLRDGRAIRAGRLSADKVYAKNFLTEAMADVRVNDGTKTYQGTKEQLEAKAKFHKDIRVRTSAYRSYAYMIQSISRNAIGGKGFLWDALMEGKNGWVDCNDKRLAMDNIDNQEILAHVQVSGLKSVADLQRLFDQQLVDKNGNPYVFRYETDRTGRIDQDIRPTIGWATYIVLCFEQDDMAPTMEKMRITEEQVQQIRDMLPKAAKEFLKWSREMLSDRRQRIYNPASLERFGTQMANIPNYFPIRRLEKNLHRVEEVEQVASADSDQVTIMANALIKRVRNVVEIDFQQNPLELLKKHLERMNGFAANVPLARNVNILLNSSGFRDQLNEQGDPNTYEYFKAAAKVALSSYKPKPGALDSVMIELQGWLAAGKIAWRFFTALKQLLSIPAFWTYNISPRYKAIFIRSVLWPAVKNGDEGKLVAIWKWGMDNIPQLKERWSSRYAGNEKLAQVKETLTAQFIAKHAVFRNSVGKIGEWGMIPNAAVDLFACSIGCYAVYKFELEQLQKKGYSKEEADELAKRRASIAFNESQQSSEAAFIAPLQRDRTFLAVQVSLFNNSNFGYGRKEKLARKYLWQQTFNKDLREKRLALAKRRYLERFLNEERNRLVENNNKIADVAQRLRPEEIDRMVESKRAEFSKRAEKEANRDAEMSYAKGVEDVVMFKWLLNMAWAMAPTAVSYWLSCAIRQGDDEDPENPLSAETLALMFATATFRNAIGGGLLESGLNGYGFTGLVGSEVEKTVDILAQALQPLWLTDEETESFDPLAVWMAVKQCLVMGTGFDVNVYANILTGLVGLFNDRSRTTADVLRILNAPKSMIREIEIIPFEDETLDNYTRRMAMMENVALDRMEELKGIPSSELNASELKVLRKKKKWEKNLITIRQAEAADVPYGREVDGRVVAPGLKQLDADYTDLLKSLDLTQSGKNRAGKVEFTEDERRRKKALRVVTRVKGIHNMEESAIEVINNPEAYKKEYRQIVEEKRKLIEDWNK